MKKVFILFSIFFVLITCGCNTKTYTATFKDSDGTVLRVLEVPNGEAPIYEGTPEKPSDDLYDYRFFSWDKELAPTNEDTVYTAIYISSVKNDEDEVVYVDDLDLEELKGNTNNELLDDSLISETFFVTFLDDDNKTILQKTEYNYGTEPAFNYGSPGSKVIGDYLYTFTGWDKTFTPVKGEQTYVAKYKKEKIQKNNSSSPIDSSALEQISQKQGNYVLSTTEKLLDFTVTLKAYDISHNQEGGGTFTGAGSYKINARAYIEAIPNKGMHFVKWNDGDTSSTKNIVVTDNVTFTAYFEKNIESSKSYFNVSVKTSDVSCGVVGIDPNRSDHMYEEGETVTISASAKPGYKFNGWIDSNGVTFGDVSEQIKTFDIERDATYIAMFVKDTTAEIKKDDDNGKVTINARLNNNKAAYVSINGKIQSSLSVDKGSNVDIKVYLTTLSAKFLGWSLTNNKTSIDSVSESLKLNSVQKDTTVTGFVEVSGSDDVISGEDPTPKIEFIDAIIKSDPEGACSFNVNNSDEIPESLIIGNNYLIKFIQTPEQSKRYTFEKWTVGGTTYDSTLDLSLNINESTPQQIIAHFIDNNDYKGAGGEGTLIKDLNKLSVGDVITFNGDDANKYFIFDKYVSDGKTISKVIPVGLTLSSQYSITKTNSANLMNANLLKTCISFANDLTNPILINHLFNTNIKVYDYLNTDENNSYSVHKSIIDASADPTEILTYNTSCYPLGLGEIDKFYNYSGKKGIYSATDLENFIKTFTGNSNNTIWLKDLVSFNNDSYNTGIYISKDGIKTTSLSSYMSFLPVLVVQLDDTLDIRRISENTLTKTNKYTITFGVNNLDYGSVEVDNRSYLNIFEENEQIKFRFINSNSALYNFIKWSDENTDVDRTINATRSFDFIAYAGFFIDNFNANFDVVSYIKSNGNQYINTGYLPTANTKIELQYEPLENDKNKAGAICGVTEGDKKLDAYYTKIVKDKKDKIQYVFNSNNSSKNDMTIDPDYEKLTISPRKFVVTNLANSNSIYEFKTGEVFSGSDLPLFLFASNDNGNPTGLSKMRLYSCKIYENDTLVRNMIPVCNKATTDTKRKYGLFDTIELVYYPSLFVDGFLGPNDTELLFNKYTQLSYLQNNGLSYIDTGTKASNDIGIFAKIMPLSYTNANYIGSVDDNLVIASKLDTSKDDYASLVAKYNHGSASYTNEYYSTNNTKPLSIYSIGYNFLSSKKFYSINNSDSSYVENIDNQKSISTSTKNIYIGKANGDDYNIGPARYYNVIISDKNNIIHNYYPVKDSEGKFGFLDLVTQEFKVLTNSSFTTPKEITDGLTDISDVKILTRVIGEGTQYIDTGVVLTGTTGIRLSYIPLEFYNSYYMGTVDNTGKGFALTGNLSKDDSSHPNQSSALMIDTSNNPNYYYADQEYAIEAGKPNPIISDARFLNQDLLSAYYSLSNVSFTKNISETEKTFDFSTCGNITIGNVKSCKKGPGIFYYAAISDKQVVTHFYLPAQKGDDIGFYDVVDYKFFKSEDGNFIDGTFKDDTKCQITITADEPLNLTRKLNNSADPIVKNVDTIDCGFLSVIDCEVEFSVSELIGKSYLFDKWSDGNTDTIRHISLFQPNTNITLNADSREITFSPVSVDFKYYEEDKTLPNNVVSLSYYSTLLNKEITDGKYIVGDKVKITAKINDTFNKTYRWEEGNPTTFEKEITVDSKEDNNKYKFTLYPFKPRIIVNVADSEGNELPLSDFNIEIYLSNDELYDENSDTVLNVGDTVTIKAISKDYAKYISSTYNSTISIQYTIETEYNNYVTFTFMENDGDLYKGALIRFNDAPNTYRHLEEISDRTNSWRYFESPSNYYRVIKMDGQKVTLLDIAHTLCIVTPSAANYKGLRGEKVVSKSSSERYYGVFNLIDMYEANFASRYFDSLPEYLQKDGVIIEHSSDDETHSYSHINDPSSEILYNDFKWGDALQKVDNRDSKSGYRVRSLSLAQVCEYLDIDYKSFNTSNSFRNQMTFDKQRELYKMFGFSNKIYDYSFYSDGIFYVALSDYLDKSRNLTNKFVGITVNRDINIFTDPNDYKKILESGINDHRLPRAYITELSADNTAKARFAFSFTIDYSVLKNMINNGECPGYTFVDDSFLDTEFSKKELNERLDSVDPVDEYYSTLRYSAYPVDAGTFKNQTDASKNLAVEEVSIDSLKKGDIIRVNGVPNAVNFKYSLYYDNGGPAMRYWNHINNLYRVIKVDDDKGHIVLMDLTNTDQLMISFDELNKLIKHNYEWFGGIKKKNCEQPTWLEKIFKWTDHLEDDYRYFIRYYDDNGNRKTATVWYDSYDFYDHEFAYAWISRYLLNAYYYNYLPKAFRDATVPNHYTWEDEYSETLGDRVYLLNIREILEYINDGGIEDIYKYEDNQLDEKYQKALFEMFGFSNKYWDYSIYRYFSAPVNFLINSSVYHNVKKNRNTTYSYYSIGQDGYYCVKLKNITGEKFDYEIDDDYYHKAIITKNNDHLDSTFCFMRPCFTVDKAKFDRSVKIYRVSDESVEFLNKNYSGREFVYDDPDMFAE